MRRRFAISALLVSLFLAPVALCAESGEKDVIPAYLAPVAGFLSRGDDGMLPAGGNSIEVITDGARQWESLLADIRSARKSIYMEYYRWTDDDAGRQIKRAVMEKIREGLDVRIMLEDLCNPFYRKDFYTDLKKAGAQVAYFTDTERHLWEIVPGINTRDHRKIVVIDDCIGYTGGMNLSVHYRDVWRDTHTRIQGPAVAQLHRLFMEMWLLRRGPEQNDAASGADTTHVISIPEAGNTTVQFATSGGGDTLLEEAVCMILQSARSSVYIQTPYFCPTDTMLHSLQAAARRGIDVRILIPEKSDSHLMQIANQGFFEECVSSGVRIYEYEPRFNHSKVVVCDGCLSCIGSLNLDSRSLCINYEAFAAIYGTETGALCRETFLALLEDSHEVTMDHINAWSKKEKNARRFWRRNSSQL